MVWRMQCSQGSRVYHLAMIPRQPRRGETYSRARLKAERVARLLATVILVLLLAAIAISAVLLYRKVASTIGRSSGSAVIVPDVIGLTQEGAEQALVKASLGAQVTQNANTDEQPAGKVFRQDPPAGMRVRPGRQIKLMVSLGPPSYTVPKLTGETLDRAVGILANARLSLGQVTRIYARGAKRGRILSQTPPAGTSIASPAGVDVVVADTASAETVLVPLVSGRSLVEAEDALVRANLQLAKVTYVADDTLPAGTVITQEPAGNSDASVGDKVELKAALPTAVMAAPTRTVSIRIRVPAGPEKQRVKVKVWDRLGGQVREDSEHSPGDTVEQKIDIEGSAKIQVFVGDMNTPIREDVL
jgi:serine/threonine-protein kinase